MSDYQQPPPQMGAPQPVQGEFYKPPGVYFESIGDAWTLLTRDLGAWIGVSLLGIVLIMLVTAPFSIVGTMIQNGGELLPTNTGEFNIGAQLLGTFISFLGNAVSYPVMAGMFWVALKQVRGESISISDLFEGFRNFVPLAVTGILYTLALIIGAVLCLIPMLYLLGALSFAPFLVLDKGLSPMEALQTSAKTLGSNAWMMLVLIIVLSIIASIGMCLFCVGFVFTLPLYFIAIALTYNYYFPSNQGGYVLPSFPQG